MKTKEKEIDLFKFENELVSEGIINICGVDEAGRGPLAGPVVVASVIMPLDEIVDGVNDSKKLSEKKREELFEKIVLVAKAFHVEFIDHDVIDDINILNATKKGMENCVNLLSIKPDIALIDAVGGLNVKCKTKAIIHGDALSYSIAAASIVAKVSRDRYMREMDKVFPEYGFAIHKGYGTKMHMDKLKEIGPCEIHRKSFLKFLGENK